jgi:hypothetical protein
VHTALILRVVSGGAQCENQSPTFSRHPIVMYSTRAGIKNDTRCTLTGHRYRDGAERGRAELSHKAAASCRGLPLSPAKQEAGGGGWIRALWHPAEDFAFHDRGAAGSDRREAKTLRGDHRLPSDDLFTSKECCISCVINYEVRLKVCSFEMQHRKSYWTMLTSIL